MLDVFIAGSVFLRPMGQKKPRVYMNQAAEWAKNRMVPLNKVQMFLYMDSNSV